MVMQTIYCVEDDESIRELVLYALKGSGFAAEGFSAAPSFFAALQKKKPDCVLLDIMLPGTDGLQILKELRENPHTGQIPVIMLTAKTSEYDKVKGLDMGADDYIAKPFGVMELISRVKALLRRSQGQNAEHVLSYGDLTLDPDRRLVIAQNEKISLTYKEFELLYCLLQNQGIVLSRDKIMEKVWGFDFEGESRTVDMHIKSLRQKLGTMGKAIQTVRGVGYKIGG